jgi:hypothetical protein
MTHEIIKGQDKRTRDRVRELFNKHGIGDPNGTRAKHDRFLSLLKTRYGYSNDKAVTELQRLLQQFYVTNRSLGIHHARPNIEQPSGEEPE